MHGSTRRDFLWLAGLVPNGMMRAWARRPAMRSIFVEVHNAPGILGRLAQLELERGLRRLGVATEIHRGTSAAGLRPGDLGFRLIVEPGGFRDPESYQLLARSEREVEIRAGSPVGLLYAIYELLESQGVVFGIDGEYYPLEPPARLLLPPPGQAWTRTPRFRVRGLLPWPDFLNCITVYNDEDFQAYFEAMLRMRLNTFGMHVYTGAGQWAESYLSFEFAGAGHIAFLDTTATHRWGYLPVRTSRFTMGASEFYDRETFGSDASRLGRDIWEIAEATQGMLGRALRYARQLGIRTGIGFEPYQIPDEIWRALPPEVRPAQLPPRNHPGERFQMESYTSRKLLEARLAQLLEAYPEVDYVWLWEDEAMNWASRRQGVPLSLSPFLWAHDFLKRHAPDKRLVVAGWGGVARHFREFHQRLPGDIIFSCLSDSLGWDPVHEVFSELEGRERWPIPWLEDDPGMWQPQFHVHRFDQDIRRAAQYGCQGMLGIHWRHRIVDPTAGFFARALWDPELTPERWYHIYCRTQAQGERAARLAETLVDVDRHRRILTSFTGRRDQAGHAVIEAYSGDYDEAFTYWRDYEPSPQIRQSQKQVLVELQQLIRHAGSDLERERLGYLAGHLAFLVFYAESWVLARQLHQVLEQAGALRKAGREAAVAEVVREQALPLWLELAGQVRNAMLAFQRIVATRNDLGTLASLHIKFVRLALYRLPLSIQEYLHEMPPALEQKFAEVTQPDEQTVPRLIVPTRPGLLFRGTRVRLLIIAPGGEKLAPPRLHFRRAGERRWRVQQARLVGRRTFEVFLGPFQDSQGVYQYYASAGQGAGERVAPPGAPAETYWLTVV